MQSKRLTQIQQFLAETPNDPFLLFALAKEYEKLEQHEQAHSYYLRLTQEHPDYVGTYYHLGRLQVSFGQYEEALSTYEKGMEIAKAVGDRHAYAELAGAKMEIEED
ncbi:MAG: tetratricopeptide repeat protein [Bacteroidota bacterium]